MIVALFTSKTICVINIDAISRWDPQNRIDVAASYMKLWVSIYYYGVVIGEYRR